MNNTNYISKDTKLYGYIAQSASVSRFSALMNKMFKDKSIDAMMAPMNIREDDFYFTITNVKKSQLKALILSNEYTDKVIELLDESSSLVKRSGMCDLVFIEDEKLKGELFSVRVLSEYLKNLHLSKIAIIGTNHYAKAFSFLSCGFNVSYFNDNLEELMAFTQEVELKDADLNRIADGMDIDFSLYDAVLDFSNLSSLSMVTKLSRYNFDMKNDKDYSTLKQRCGELDSKYISCDDMVENLCSGAYNQISR